jgi:hypothetical protein
MPTHAHSLLSYARYAVFNCRLEFEISLASAGIMLRPLLFPAARCLIVLVQCSAYAYRGVKTMQPLQAEHPLQNHFLRSSSDDLIVCSSCRGESASQHRARSVVA